MYGRCCSLVWVMIAAIGIVNGPQVSAQDQEIGFLEDFVLSPDREAALKQLVPGTEDYYYYHALHYQTTQQLDKVDALFEQWKKRFGETGLLRRIRNRQMLLKYSDDPQAALAYLKQELGLNFNHQREIPQAQRKLPIRLDPSLIDVETLLKQALANNGLDKITDQGLDRLAGQQLSAAQRRYLLQRLDRPDFPDLVALIDADLKERDSQPFGSIAIHRMLTQTQLDALAKLQPRVATSDNFVNLYLARLVPGDDVDWSNDRNSKRAYLLRLWEFVDTLPPTFNSLKANVLYQRLELDLKEEKYDRELFMAYLKLPRNMFYVNPEVLRSVASQDHVVKLESDYSGQTFLPPIRTDESLVRQYLHHFLVDANDYQEFEPWVRDDYLKQQFATAKILAGVGDVEKWASLLGPEQYRSLLERIDLDFSPLNPEFFDPDQDVTLSLDIKNVDKLIVKVFEMNTQNYYRKHRTEIDTDVNLDGLVPNAEYTFEYDTPPAVRKRQQFSFPELKQRGVFIVDFIAGGKSSRALVRKGRLELISEVTSVGHLMTVIDRQRNKVSDANLWIEGRRYDPDQHGQILVPFSTRPGSVQAVITQGPFSCLQEFQHQAESYEFKASLVVDREDLTRGKDAAVVIRPSLQVAGAAQAPVSLIEKPKLIVTSVNLDGLSTSQTISDIKLLDDRETVCKLMISPRLKSLSLNLTGQLKRLSDGKRVAVSANQVYQINEIDLTDNYQDVHLVPTPNGYLLEILGKSGEVRPAQAVRVAIQMDDFTDPVYVDLQSDDNGMVQLGELAGVRSINVQPSLGQEKNWVLETQDQTYRRTIQVKQGEQIELPAPPGVNAPQRNAISLFEVRRGQVVRDVFDAVAVDRGLIKIQGLAAGDYQLRLTSPVTNRTGQFRNDILLRVTEGNPVAGVLVSDARHLEQNSERQVQIATLQASPDKLRIELENSSAGTRVHVIASRYQPAFGAYQSLAAVNGIEPWYRVPSTRRSVYQEGRQIGDEYEYILRRKYATLFPGNMLQRPTLLLNPWAVRPTTNQSQDANAGGEFGAAGNAADAAADRVQAIDAGDGANTDFANVDYLGEGSVVLANLVPNESGVVTIDRAQLGNGQHIRVFAVNMDQTIERNINLDLKPLDPRDSRLANSLDPNKHFSQSKQTDVLLSGESVKIRDLVSARFQQYDDLGDVYTLLQALNPSPHLTRFQFVLTWMEQESAEKQRLYSEYACHELNFFLMKKDPEFFKSVVRPHLQHKSRKTFVDHYLLGDDLEAYTQPWNFARLNVLERILLAERLEARAADLVRSINETYSVSPTPRTLIDQLYDTTINGLGLDTDDGIALQMRNKQDDLSRIEAEFQPGLAQAGKDAEYFYGGKASGGGGGMGGMAANAPAPSSAMVADSPGVMESKEAGKPSEKMAINGRQLRSLGRKSAELQLNRDKAGAMLGEMLKKAERVDADSVVSVPDGGTVLMGGIRRNLEELEDLRQTYKRLYRNVEPTQEWIENNYYLLQPDQQTPELVAINQFWKDYANHGGGTFLSPHFAEAHRTFTESMMALAVLDLPLKSPENKVDFADNSMTFTAGGPAIVLHQQVQDAVFERGNTKILVSENFYQKNDRYRFEDDVQYDKFVTGDFLTHTLYGGQVVITNPTSTPRAVELLIQIPSGSVACSGAQETRTIQLDLEAFSTKTFEYAFYFPTAGQFPHYPAHVSSKERVLAVADPTPFQVVDQQAELDTTSWEFVSQNGTDDAVIDFLNQNNVLRLNLDKIAFRMKDKRFFQTALEALRNRYVYSNTLWSYGVQHNDVRSIREFMTHDNGVSSNCGLWFESELLQLDPVERNWYGHKEYWPLVNARAHQLGPQRKILNPDFAQQYRMLLEVLSNRRTLGDEEQLVITYYLLLQDRIEAALDHFAMVSRDKLASQMQYDYCDAYLDFYRGKADEAGKKAGVWADYPVDHWRKRFQAILAQVDELKGGDTKAADPDNQSQQQTELAAKSESIDLEITNGVARVKAQNVRQVTVNYYKMDIELLFSRSPFAQDELDSFSLIRPNLSESVELQVDDAGKASQELKLPEAMQNRNVLVEVIAGDQTRSQPYFAHSLDLKMFENYGQLQVLNEATGKPIPKTYVKVYARMNDGTERFHKDGYTDLRGRFDYVSQSNRPMDGIAKFAILILSEESGAIVRQADPPLQ